MVRRLLWDGSNLVKAIIHQTTAVVASLVTIHSVNPSLGFSQGSKRIFSFSLVSARGAIVLVLVVVLGVELRSLVVKSRSLWERNENERVDGCFS